MDNKGFVAALDQSGGSIKKALLSYGVEDLSGYLFEKIHDMRVRVLKNLDYSKISGVILFDGEVNKNIDGMTIGAETGNILRTGHNLQHGHLWHKI